jgi:hypothetical protein
LLPALGVIAVLGGAGLLLGPGAATAAPAAHRTGYSCPFPFVGGQPVTASMGMTFPDVVGAFGHLTGQNVTVTMALPARAADDLRLQGAATVGGTATGHLVVDDEKIVIPVALPGLAIAPVPVPATGGMDVVATGAMPTITLPLGGTARITVSDLDLSLTSATGTGQSAGAPITAACTVALGQDAALASVPVSDALAVSRIIPVDGMTQSPGGALPPVAAGPPAAPVAQGPAAVAAAPGAQPVGGTPWARNGVTVPAQAPPLAAAARVGPPLAVTGVSVLPQLAIGALLLVTGALLVTVARRRLAAGRG